MSAPGMVFVLTNKIRQDIEHATARLTSGGIMKPTLAGCFWHTKAVLYLTELPRLANLKRNKETLSYNKFI